MRAVEIREVGEESLSPRVVHFRTSKAYQPRRAVVKPGGPLPPGGVESGVVGLVERLQREYSRFGRRERGVYEAQLGTGVCADWVW